MPSYDLLTYTDFSASEMYAAGEVWPLGDGMRIVGTLPPIHEGKDATLIVAYGEYPMPQLVKRLQTGLEPGDR